MNDNLLDDFAQLIVQRIGLRITDDDRCFGILRERAAHLGHTSLKSYQTFLVNMLAIEEWEEFARAFTSTETFFFRDHGQFDLLRFHLLPELIAQQSSHKTLHLWSAACSSGEEAYSLAMLVDMLLPQREGWNILILGTDIDSKAIAKAQRGRYGEWSFRMFPAELQQRYFHPEGKQWILEERIRSMVTFQVSNLVSERFPDSNSDLHDMALILCRNVFIYFDPAAVFAVATKFAQTLRVGGYLLTAHTELIGHPVPELEPRLLAEGVVYQRRICKPEESCYIPHLGETTGETPRHSAMPLNYNNQVNKHCLPEHAGESVLNYTTTQPFIGEENLLKEARNHAHRGEFDLAERLCHKALAIAPLAATPFFLLAQLAQVKEDFNQAKECLNKAIYLDPGFVAAYLELAALCERANDNPRALTLRHAALSIARTLPNNELIEQYETTAGELAQWLEQFESLTLS
jgi:chemotaxis protein methyltransferase CheR